MKFCTLSFGLFPHPGPQQKAAVDLKQFLTLIDETGLWRETWTQKVLVVTELLESVGGSKGKWRRDLAEPAYCKEEVMRKGAVSRSWVQTRRQVRQVEQDLACVEERSLMQPK